MGSKYGNILQRKYNKYEWKRIGAPFVIKAIGLPEYLSGLQRPGGYLYILKEANVGVNLEKSNNITIPKYTECNKTLNICKT